LPALFLVLVFATFFFIIFFLTTFLGLGFRVAFLPGFFTTFFISIFFTFFFRRVNIEQKIKEAEKAGDHKRVNLLMEQFNETTLKA